LDVPGPFSSGKDIPIIVLILPWMYYNQVNHLVESKKSLLRDFFVESGEQKSNNFIEGLRAIDEVFS
jgi:hypothetical protein